MQPEPEDKAGSDQNESSDRTQAWQLIFEQLAEAPDRDDYTQQLQQAAKTMNCSIRAVQRHLDRWKEVGNNSLQVYQLKRRTQISEELKQWIIELYYRGNRGGNTLNPRQVFQMLRFKFFTEGNFLGQEVCPSLSTIYRILNPVIEAQRQNQLRPGEVKRLQVPLASFSNEVWWCNLIQLPRQVRDCFGIPAGYPILTTLHDESSQNVMGAKLTLSSSPEEAIALTLRQAILPKKIGEDNASFHPWTACGFPVHLVVNCSKNFSRLSTLCSTLGVKLHWERLIRSMSGVIEAFRRQIMCALAQLPESGNQQIFCLGLAALEQFITHYLVDHYNHQSFSKDLHHTRTERWEAGLVKFPPDVPPERSLDICFPKTRNRIIQKGGQLRFEGQSYRDDYLSSHAGESVFLRFNPSNITSVLVYQEQGYEEHFLARACIQNFHEESLSLADAKAILRRRQKRRAH